MSVSEKLRSELQIFTNSYINVSEFELCLPHIGTSKVFIGVNNLGINISSKTSLDNSSICVCTSSSKFTQYLCPLPILIIALAEIQFAFFLDFIKSISVGLIGAAF